jgi:zinc transport system permease protein
MNTLQLFWPAMLAGIVVAAVSGPLGSLLVWRRLSWFGDSLAHAALLGVGLSLLLSVPGWLGIASVCVGMAFLLALLLRRPELATDTVLILLSTTALSLGLIVIGMADVRVDVTAYLFGDLLAIAPADLPLLLLGGVVVIGVLVWQWRGFVMASIHEELAAVDGVPIQRLRLLLLLLLAIVVTAAMKVVGVLLITALLVIPAAAARRLSRTPEQMAVAASVMGVIAVLAGLAASLYADLPLGPAIVVAAAAGFLGSSLLPRAQH